MKRQSKKPMLFYFSGVCGLLPHLNYGGASPQGLIHVFW